SCANVFDAGCARSLLAGAPSLNASLNASFFPYPEIAACGEFGANSTVRSDLRSLRFSRCVSSRLSASAGAGDAVLAAAAGAAAGALLAAGPPNRATISGSGASRDARSLTITAIAITPAVAIAATGNHRYVLHHGAIAIAPDDEESAASIRASAANCSRHRTQPAKCACQR